MDMNNREFVFLMATPDLRIEWSGNETAEHLTTVRFPPNNSMHDSVKRFCERAQPGDFLQTAYGFIFCSYAEKESEQEQADDALFGIDVEPHPFVQKQKVYIAGKITGLEYDEAFRKFERAEQYLTAQGYEPINPMKKVSEQKCKTWAEYMCEDMTYLFACEAIYLLSDWFDSKGARIEFAIAKELGLNILFEGQDLAQENKQLAEENEKLRKVIASRGKLF